MTKKFTEEQYQKIVEIADEYQGNSVFGIIGDTMQNSIGAKFYKTEELCNEIEFNTNAGELMAIFNPLTREWAHDKFVEKEERYVWTSKEVNSSGKHKRLFIQQQSASVRDYFILDKHGYDDNELITESEIKKWGYAPERFYKEEV